MKQLIFIFLSMLYVSASLGQGLGHPVNFIIESRNPEMFTFHQQDSSGVFYAEYKCLNICIETRYYFRPVDNSIIRVVEESYEMDKLDGIIKYMNENYEKKPNNVWLDYKDSNQITLKINSEDSTFHIFYKNLIETHDY